MAMLKVNKPQSIEAYITLQEAFMRPKLEQIRKTINKAAPGAEEIISYSMPAFKYHDTLISKAFMECQCKRNSIRRETRW